MKKKKPAAAKNLAGASFYINVTLRVIKSLFVGFILVLFLGGMLALGIGAGYFAYLVEGTSTPTKEEVKQTVGDITEASKLLYADNKEIATISADPIRQKVDTDEISPWVKKAIVATEDEYFYEHHGVVPKAVLRALISEVSGFGSGSGGSTLTQQLIKQQVLTSETSFKRKANEIVLALDVEKYLSKDEILTAYLNVSPFGRNNKGQNIAGVEEAAMGIFGVHAQELNLPQAAFIAGLPQSPIVYSPYTNTGDLKEDYSIGLDRKNNVLFNMYREKIISQQEYEEALNYDLAQDFQPREEIEDEQRGFLYYTIYNEAVSILAKQQATQDGVSESDYEQDDVRNRYVEQARVKIQNQGLTVQSTIDKNIYDAMQLSAAEYGQYLDNGSGTPIETGNILMDNQTGRIYGFVGSRDYSTNQNNHAFDTLRQPGSSIKPLLVYGPAIDQGLIGSGSRIADFPMKYQRGENAGKELRNATGEGSKTFQTTREALVESTNIPAYHVYQELLTEKGSEQFVYENYLKKMNYQASSDWGVESAPLGTVITSTLTQVNGFQALANEGVYQEGYLIESITDSTGKEIYKHQENPVQVYSKAAATIMTDMMRSVVNEQETTPFKSLLSGVNYTLSTADWVGKTGTTDNYADNWLIVSTPSVTLGSWTGRDDNQPMDSNAGNRTATYMAYLAGRIYSVNPSVFGVNEDFELSDDVKKEKVSTFTGLKPGRVTHEGTTYQVPSGESDSLWAKDGPADNTYKFGIGGTDSNYEDYWDTRRSSRNNNNATTNNNTTYNNNNNNNDD
ncbi:transglycosylase domain-containing protein [Enterococcus sp. AZ109]|uniref:transglycosylase domain-containing protein n=1 Tax=Enterococcus sp. AZ109 TaxID=2774634 RepID=UPI003F684460